MTTTAANAPSQGISNSFRWTQLIIGIVCMAMMANLQYGWTFFVGPMAKAHNWEIASIQVAFSLFIAFETWLTPIEGFIVDWIGPRGPKIMIAIGGVFAALGWLINSQANSLEMLYLGAILSGTGAGGVYATCVGNAVRWFPDRRGLAVGLTAAGFGAGAALTVIPIQKMIASIGYADTFFWFALVQGGIVFVLAWFVRPPRSGEVPAASAVKVLQSKTSSNPGQVLRSPLFWILYLMFISVSASGLMVTAQLSIIAKDYGVAQTIILFGLPTLTLAGIIDSVCNGGARPFFGWVSDQIGREYTMAIAFSLGAVAYWLLGTAGTTPWAFVICAAIVFFTWGEIFSLFPSTTTDIFGPKYATTNTALMYSAKGVSAFVVPLANVLKTHTGSWHAVFVVASVLNLLVVAAALFVLRPMRLSMSAAEKESGVPQPAE
jgi:OFA family oxalate/formate antiporter-like MFS transporter